MNRLNHKLVQVTDTIQQLRKDQHTVGISVSITYENEIIYAEGFGYSNFESSSPSKMTPNTIMNIQSVSKNFMACSIMKLVEDSLIKLDDPVVEYLPYFQTMDKKMSDLITVRQLLSHTAGFPSNLGVANMIAPNVKELHSDYPTEYQEALDHYRLTDEELNSINSREDITRWFSKVKLDYPPGTGWQYCTDAYVIVCDLFEKVTGRSWETHLQHNLFNPLGMKRSSWDYRVAEADPDHASYYFDKEMKLIGYPQNPISAPIGYLYSTANDLAKYLSAQLNDEPLLLKKKSLSVMQTPVAHVKGDWSRGSEIRGYGLAWFTDSYKGLKFVEHAGGQIAVRALISMIPELKIGIAVLLNFNSQIHYEIGRKIFNIFVERNE